MTITKKQEPEVIDAPTGRRRWTAFQKKQMVEETYDPGKTVSFVARKHGISPAQLFNWRRHMEEGALVGIDTEQKVLPEIENKRLQSRIKQLERILGQKTVEVEILKEAVKIGREKKLISRAPLQGIEDFQ
jgi:transposase